MTNSNRTETSLRKLKTSILIAAMVLGSVPVVQAQTAPGLATVVAACGTPPSTYVAGTNRPITQDTTGTGCSGVGGTITPIPSSSSAAGIAPVFSSAVETGHVIKAGAGNLYSLDVTADSTLSGAAWAIMVFNSTTVPAAGAVTPAWCITLPAGTTSYTGAFPTPMYLATGISIAVSVGQTCFTKVDSAHGFISAMAK